MLKEMTWREIEGMATEEYNYIPYGTYKMTL